MTDWQDSENRTWEIKFTVATLENIKNEMKLDLSPDSADNIATFAKLQFESRKLGEVLWHCCKTDDVSRADFMRGLGGDALAAGWKSLVNTVVAFVAGRNQRLAEAIREAIDVQSSIIDVESESVIRTIKAFLSSDELQLRGERIAEQLQAEFIEAIDSKVGKDAISKRTAGRQSSN